METLIFLPFPPDDIRGIERIIRERDSFVALMEGDLYSIGQHIAERDNFRFSAVLDRNVYTRITALVKGDEPRPSEISDLRWAAAILAFCQIADITIDYSSSLYEFAHSNGGEAALRELERFRIADNSDSRIFIEFAMGRTSRIDLHQLANVPTGSSPKPEEFEKQIRDYRVNYTFALKIAELYQQGISPFEKMIRLLDWMYADFFFGAPAILFASRLFSPNRHKRMLKDLSRAGIENAAWDMTVIQDWRRRALRNLPKNEPVLLISGDKAVRDMARRVSAETEDEMVSVMREIWGRNSSEGKRIYEHYSGLWNKVSSGSATDRNPPKGQAQIAIMQELERRVFGVPSTALHPSQRI